MPPNLDIAILVLIQRKGVSDGKVAVRRNRAAHRISVSPKRSDWNRPAMIELSNRCAAPEICDPNVTFLVDTLAVRQCETC
jgi:hypothetical protein